MGQTMPRVRHSSSDSAQTGTSCGQIGAWGAESQESMSFILRNIGSNIRELLNPPCASWRMNLEYLRKKPKMGQNTDIFSPIKSQGPRQMSTSNLLWLKHLVC